MTRGRRPRVLMLVDNFIDGDSRVQKAARGAAAEGFEVTLLGRSPGPKADTEPLGEATRRRVPVPFTKERAAKQRLQRIRRYTRWPRRSVSPNGDTWADTARARALHLVTGTNCWARLEPRLLDYEKAFWPVISAACPDILHAHDYKMVGIAVRAARRLRAAGHPVKVIYDAHEFLPGVPPLSPRWKIAYESYEAAHIRSADAVVAVSDALAQLLVERYDLPQLPTVVLNAPDLEPAPQTGAGHDLRAALGLGPQVPLLVYSGVSAARRGLGTVMEALPQLPGVQLALVTTRNPHVDELLARAAELGVADRVHVHGYVPPEQVVSFLRSATAGLIPIHHTVNHEIALITKYFEYAQAELPIITSDVRAMAEQTRALGNGEVFTAQDVADFARAARAVLADPDGYRKAYAEHAELLARWTWPRQAQVLAELYRRLLADGGGSPG